MSHVIYGQNKVLCFIQLDKALVQNNDNPFLQVN